MVQSQQPPPLVDDHAHRVEADRACARSLVALVAQPCAREPAQACALARAQPRQRLLVGTDRPPAESGGAGLDLDEYERLAVKGDQVDLAVTGAHVARERREAEPGQVLGGEILAEATDRASCVDALLAAAGSGRISGRALWSWH